MRVCIGGQQVQAQLLSQPAEIRTQLWGHGGWIKFDTPAWTQKMLKWSSPGLY